MIPENYEFKTLIDEMKIRGFSRQTIESYHYHNVKFLNFIKKSPKEVTKSDIEKYLVHLYDKEIASATRHLICSALKFYYEMVLKRRFNLIHPKKSNSLPIVLTKNEILEMINSLQNPKHRLLIELMYGSGLRVGEAVKIKIEDFNLERKTLHIKSGKGNKDRITNLSEKFISDFKDFTHNKQYGFLFESSARERKHISIRTAEQIIKNALGNTRINKNAHPHTLRTSYATHLVESGTDISFIQKFLGHSDIKTTQIYLRLTNSSIQNIKSPLD